MGKDFPAENVIKTKRKISKKLHLLFAPSRQECFIRIPFRIDWGEFARESNPDEVWWLPKPGTNAVKELIEKAINKRNYVSASYVPILKDEKLKEKYLEGWYELISEIVRQEMRRQKGK